MIGSVAALARLQQGIGAGDDVLVSYVPVLMIFVVAAGFAVTMVTLSRLVGQRKPTKEKMMPYECGKDPVGSARERHSVRFYMVAMIFLLFDIEAIFLIPWAVAYGRVLEGGLESWRWTAETATSMKFLFYGEMMFFILVLFLGLIYVWKKGVLEWNR